MNNDNNDNDDDNNHDNNDNDDDKLYNDRDNNHIIYYVGLLILPVTARVIAFDHNIKTSVLIQCSRASF